MLEFRLCDSSHIRAACNHIEVTHMRFVAEARMAAPITGYFGYISSNGNTTVLAELRNSRTNSVLAAFTYHFDSKLKATSHEPIVLPGYAGAKGITDGPLPYVNCTLETAYACGFVTTGKGVIQDEECDSSGYLMPHHYMGRSSDSMPNLWAIINQDNTRGTGESGGAVLEYRMNHYSLLKGGDRFVLVSGFYNLGDKTEHMIHLMFNPETEKMVIGSESVGINMDLVARKAVSIPPERRALIENSLLRQP